MASSMTTTLTRYMPSLEAAPYQRSCCHFLEDAIEIDVDASRTHGRIVAGGWITSSWPASTSGDSPPSPPVHHRARDQDASAAVRALAKALNVIG